MNNKVRTISVSLLCIALSVSFLSCEADTGVSGSDGETGVTKFQLSETRVTADNTASGSSEYIIKYRYNSKGLATSAIVCDASDESKIMTLSPSTAKDLHHLYTYDSDGNLTKDDVYSADADGDGTLDSEKDAAGQYKFTEYTYEKGLKQTESAKAGSLISLSAQAKGVTLPVGTPIVVKSYSYDDDKRTTLIAVRGYVSLSTYPANYADEITTNVDKALTYEGDSKYPSTEVTTVSLNGRGSAASQLQGTTLPTTLPVGFVLSKIEYTYDSKSNVTGKNTGTFNGASYSVVNWTMKYTSNSAGTSSYLTLENSRTGSAADTSNLELGDDAPAGSKVVYGYSIEKGLLKSMEKQDKDGKQLKQGKYLIENTYDAKGNHKKEVATTVESDTSVTTMTYEYSYKYAE